MKKTLLVVLGAVILAGVLTILITKGGDNAVAEINSFEDCVAAGNPVMESFPRQCRTEDGQLFAEEVEGDQTGTSSQSVTISGEVTKFDASEIAVDGLYRFTVETDDGETVVEVPSMGMQLCEAYENINNVSDIEVGQQVSVRGSQNSEGVVVPCESSNHYIRVQEDANTDTVSVGETVMVNGLSLTLEEIVQESRCPADAECIEAGAITVRVTLENGEAEMVNIASDDVPYEFGEYRVSITDIQPPLMSGETIAQSDYNITFRVTN